MKAKKQKKLPKSTIQQDRFRELSPCERDALRVLVQNHLNSISEISLHQDFRIMDYLAWLEAIEYELITGKRG